MEVEEAHCLHDLGHDDRARVCARRALATLSPTRVRRRAIDHALLAVSLVDTGDVDEACAQATEAAGCAARTQSFRTVSRVRQVLTVLRPYGGQTRVRDVGSSCGRSFRG
ncbi:hypothetical protein [Embleya sp. NPDC005575]|uniref:hypothetical protein n=1 Tax=Embleya sp. NPDC005575 TaxID=3156892 RepID=UPI0033A5E3E2